MQSPKITALRGIEGSHLSVTPQLSAEPPPSCTGPGGGTLGSSEVEVVVEGDEEPAAWQPVAGAPGPRPEGVCRIVFNPGKSEVKAAQQELPN